MFLLNNKKAYKVSQVFGGTSNKGQYTFITIEDELHKGQKYPDRLKVNVWGEDLSNKVKKDSYIQIFKASEVGLANTRDKNDPNKWYQNLTIVCSSMDITVVTNVEAPKNDTNSNNTMGINDLDLPF